MTRKKNWAKHCHRINKSKDFLFFLAFVDCGRRLCMACTIDASNIIYLVSRSAIGATQGSTFSPLIAVDRHFAGLLLTLPPQLRSSCPFLSCYAKLFWVLEAISLCFSRIITVLLSPNMPIHLWFLFCAWYTCHCSDQWCSCYLLHQRLAQWRFKKKSAEHSECRHRKQGDHQQISPKTPLSESL